MHHVQLLHEDICDDYGAWLWCCWCKSFVCASTDGHVDKDNAKVGLFIAAAMGTFALMAAVYCIYNKFYTKQQYVHTQLNNDPGMCVCVYIFDLIAELHFFVFLHMCLLLFTGTTINSNI